MLQNFILFLNFLLVSTINPEVEYYKKLWKEESEKSQNWINPTYNKDFENYTQTDCQDFGTFDFIIVGAGTAGAVLANRLSANQTFTVLVLEAGGDENNFTLIPSATLKLMMSEMNWGYKTTPQSVICRDAEDKTCDYFRGKGLGGTSAINNMIFSRGNKGDFDHWEELGNSGWSYSDVLPYFKKSESVMNFIGDPVYRGTSGETGVSYSDYYHPFDEVLLKSALERGVDIVDYNGENQSGFGRAQLNIRNGRRESTNQAYLKKAIDRWNLNVTMRALVTKIEFDDNIVTGVTFLHEGTCKIAEVRNELILSAGVINTPQLLQLSLIAPKQEFPNLELIADLPVGKNFQDHICIKNGIQVTTNHSSVIKTFDANIEDYLEARGLLTSSVSAGLSFHNSSFEIAYSYTDQYEPIEITDLVPRVVKSGINLIPILYRPNSKGDVKIKSLDPLDFPLINPNVLTSHKDFELMYNSLKYVEKYLDTQAFKKINATLVKVPECEKFSGKRYWDCVIRTKGFACLHSSGTCRMGKSGENSVVDNSLKIHGFENLRVVDASVFPATVSGHYLATVLMLAEKAADIIINDYL